MIRFLTRHAAPALVLSLLAGPVLAQAPAQPSPTHLALAAEVAHGSGITRSFDAVTNEMIEALLEMQVAQPDIKKDMDEVIAILKPELELQKKKMLNNAALVFARHMTEAELTDVVVFFKSPSGRKYVEKQPPVFDDVMKAMTDWTKEVQDYVLIRAKAEMGKRGRELQ